MNQTTENFNSKLIMDDDDKNKIFIFFSIVMLIIAMGLGLLFKGLHGPNFSGSGPA